MLFEQYFLTEQSFLTIERYNQDYFNRSIGFWTQTKPDAWAKKYLSLANEAILLQTCEEKIQQYNAQSAIQRLLHYWPMNRLTTYHAMLRLKEALHDVRDNPTPENIAHLNKVFITARLQRDVFFWAYCSVRWLVGASNPWTTQGVFIMNDKNEQPLANHTVNAIQQVLLKAQHELAEYGTRLGKESFLVGEFIGNKAACATSLGLTSYEMCEQARLRIRQRQDFQTLKKRELQRILFADKLTYFRALEEEITLCQSSLTGDLNNEQDSAMILARLQSLLTLIQEGFYLNQYVYSTNPLSAAQRLGHIWEIYNDLPQQLLEFVQALSKETPDWLNPWVEQVESLANHIRCLMELSKDYASCLTLYQTIKQHKQQAVFVEWETFNQALLALEAARQQAYLAYENKQAFLDQLEQFKHDLQSLIDHEGFELPTPREPSNLSSYIVKQAISLYHQSATVANDTYQAFFPRIAADNPLFPQMEKEIQAHHRIQSQQALLNQLWQTTHSYSFSALDNERLKQQWQQLNEQLYQLGQQREAVYRQMLAWRSGNETSLLEQSMNALVSFRRDVEKKQSDYEADFEQSRQVLIYPDNNPLVYQDLKTLQLPNDKVTKKMLTQQYKNLSLKYHPDKHRFDELPPCDGLYLDSVTDKIDVLNYCARVCPDKAVYVFVKTTNHLFYANAKQYQIEHVASLDRTLLATLGLNQCPNLPISLTQEQIACIAQQTQHNHRKCFWQMQINTLQEAFQRLLTGEEGLTLEQQEQAYKQALEKMQCEEIIQKLEEQQETRTKALQELISQQKQSDENISQKIAECKEEIARKMTEHKEKRAKNMTEQIAEFQEQSAKNMTEQIAEFQEQSAKNMTEQIAEFQEQSAKDMAEQIAEFQEQSAKDIAELEQQYIDLEKKFEIFNAFMQQQMHHQSESPHPEHVSSYEKKSNQPSGGPGFFG